jgi:antitoxin MazE
MKTRIVRIGNSRGVRIPKTLLEQAGLKGEVEIKVRNGSLVIKAASQPREGWNEAFQKLAKLGPDPIAEDIAHFGNRFDEEEWEW